MPIPAAAKLEIIVTLLSINADAATELQVSNSRLAQVEAAFAAQKSEVRHVTLKDKHRISVNYLPFSGRASYSLHNPFTIKPPPCYFF